jgi:hypothetical protein
VKLTTYWVARSRTRGGLPLHPLYALTAWCLLPVWIHQKCYIPVHPVCSNWVQIGCKHAASFMLESLYQTHFQFCLHTSKFLAWRNEASHNIHTGIIKQPACWQYMLISYPSLAAARGTHVMNWKWGKTQLQADVRDYGDCPATIMVQLALLWRVTGRYWNRPLSCLTEEGKIKFHQPLL